MAPPTRRPPASRLSDAGDRSTSTAHETLASRSRTREGRLRRRMGRANENSTKLAIEEIAMTESTTGPASIVLIHGLWMTPLSWGKWTKRFSSKGYTAIAPAWPGVEGGDI